MVGALRPSRRFYMSVQGLYAESVQHPRSSSSGTTSPAQSGWPPDTSPPRWPDFLRHAQGHQASPCRSTAPEAASSGPRYSPPGPHLVQSLLVVLCRTILISHHPTGKRAASVLQDIPADVRYCDQSGNKRPSPDIGFRMNQLPHPIRRQCRRTPAGDGHHLLLGPSIVQPEGKSSSQGESSTLQQASTRCRRELVSAGGPPAGKPQHASSFSSFSRLPVWRRLPVPTSCPDPPMPGGMRAAATLSLPLLGLASTSSSSFDL